MKRRLQLLPGVTALEVVIVLGLFTVMGTGLMSLFSTSLRQWQRGTGKAHADDKASLISQKIVRDIEAGKSAADVSSGIEIRMPGYNDQGDYDRTTSGDLVRYYVSSGTLYRRVNGGTAAVVTDGVQSFTYSISGGDLQFTLNLYRQSGTMTAYTQFTQRVSLRNYVSP